MKQHLYSLWNLIKIHPLYAVLAAGVVIAGLFIFSNAIGSGIEHVRARIFDSNQVAHEKEVASLKADREAAIKRGDEAEAKALLKDAENKELKDLIAAKGGSIAASEKELEKKLEDAKKDAGNCQALADTDAQLDCLCQKLRSNGFECN